MEVLNPTKFEEVIRQKALVEFSSPWCGPCKQMAGILGELETSVPIFQVNVDENPTLASRYKIFSVPTIILFENGQPKGQQVGLCKEDKLQKLLQS